MSKKLDFLFYKNFYKFYFSKYTDTQIKNYWSNQNKDQSSIPNKDYLFKISKFNMYFYKENNLDIPTLENESKYFEHWYTKGIFENRLYRFDTSYYKESYPDLNEKELSDEALLAHWHLIGKNEGRICCKQELTNLKDLDLEIEKESMNDLVEEEKNLQKLETENNIIKSKLEGKIIELSSQFFDIEKEEMSARKQMITSFYDRNLLSVKSKNIELKESIDLKEGEQIERSSSNINKHKKQLLLQTEEENLLLGLKINELTQKNISITQEELLKDMKEIENERINYEIDLNKKSLTLKNQEIEKKKNILLDLELKKRMLTTEHEVLEMEKRSNTFKIEDIISQLDLSNFKNKMKEVLNNKLNQDLFSEDLPTKLEEKIRIKIKETNDATISNKKKIFQENLLDTGLKVVTESKLEISKRINLIKLDIQNQFNDLEQNQLKNKEILSEQLNTVKNGHIKIIDNYNDYYQKVSKQKKIIYKKYENDVIENKQLILDIEIKENRNRLSKFKNLEKEILDLDIIREKKIKELDQSILDVQNIRNTTLEQEINELQMNIKKNELSIKNQNLELEKTINDIDIKKKNYEKECEILKLKLIQEKNKKIDSYLIDTYNFREKIEEKRHKLQSSLISEMKRKNEIEIKKNYLVFEKRKNIEENIQNQFLELEKIKQDNEINRINKERVIKEKLDDKLLIEIDSLNEKRKIENLGTEIIEKMEEFLNRKMKEFDKIHSEKISYFEANWEQFCLDFQEKSNKQLEKVFINDNDYSDQFNLFLKFYSKEIEKDLLQIEESIEERNLSLVEKRANNNQLLIKLSLEEKENLELKQSNLKIKLDNVKNESELICLEKDKKDKEEYILERELKYKELEKKLLDNQQKCSVYLNEIDTDLQNKINIINKESLKEEDNLELQISFDRFFKEYLLSKSNFENLVKQRISINFCIEKIQENIKSCDCVSYIREYEEQNKLISEYNQLFKVNKKNIQDKISMILNEISLDEHLSYKSILDQGRFNKFSMIKNSLEELYNTYPNLFHKHLLGLSESKIHYEIMKYSKNRKKYIAHLHCFNIDNFESVYGSYINIIKKYFYIIITFSYGSSKDINSKDISILKIKNKGMDIGGKVACLHFLKVNKIKYDIIFFIHSKTNLSKRNQYFSPFLKNEATLSNIITSLKNNINLGAVFPNCIHSITKSPKEYKNIQSNNQVYLNELFQILEIKKKNPIIFEGNVFMMKKEVLEPLIYNLELIYSLLNDEFSFDFNWFKIYNSLGRKVTLKEAYNFFISGNSKKRVGNNIPLMLQTHSSSLPDGMIEHSIERIWDGLLMSSNKNYLIV